MRSRGKVFGIGFQKTATSSLAAGLYILGYNVTGFFGAHDPDIGEKVYHIAYDLADRFDAAQDTPWPVLYKELDERYPGSKFILTVRPTDKWINSVVKHFKNHRIPAHEWIYGVKTAKGNEDVYVRRYEDHNRSVEEYFEARPNDLLVMNITKGDGWEKLCPFLGEETPPFDFPVQNTAREKWNQIFGRAGNFLSRKIFAVNGSAGGGNQLEQGVSATYVRDILHYHFSMFDEMWEGVQQLSEMEFLQESKYFEGSVRDHLLRQLVEEHLWQNRLQERVGGAELSVNPANYQTKAAVYEMFRNNELFLREYVANLSDEGCNARVPGRNEYVWEVLVHLMNQGSEQRSLLRQMLRNTGVTVDEQSFVDFYRHKS